MAMGEVLKLGAERSDGNMMVFFLVTIVPTVQMDHDE